MTASSSGARFPGGKRFAVAICDDTDCATVTNVRPIYRFLSDLGVRSTKTVWPLPAVPGARCGGATLAQPAYLEFVRCLAAEGFEIALHNVRNHDAPRETVQLGLERFGECLGSYPRTHCNHDTNRENIYWGADRVSSGLRSKFYEVATRFRWRHYYQGHSEPSPYFWGDLCKQHIRYVRNLVFNEINVEKLNPTLPYHDPAKPWVNFWFSAGDGGDVERFCRLLSEDNQDRLEREEGVCIVYTHFGAGFCVNGEIHPRLAGLLRRLVAKAGWFVPVAELLDHLRAQRIDHCIDGQELAAMERRWLWSKVRSGTR
jgi:hypothetical protein